MTLHRVLFVALLLAVPGAHAVPIQWTLNNVVFDDGGTGSGSFTYDADLNAFSAVSINTTAGGAFGGWAYTGQAIDQPQHASQLVATTGNSLTLPGSVHFALRFDAPLTNLGGTRNLLAGSFTFPPPQGSFEVVCAVAGACAAPPARLLVSGTLSAPVVPVPAAAPLLASALSLLAWLRRRTRA